MKEAAFDIFSGLIFLAVALITGNLVLATWVALACAAAQLAWIALKRRKPSAIQWAVFGAVFVFGGATIFFQNPIWVKLKPSALEAMLGLAMLRPGWFYRYLPKARAQMFSRRLVVGTGLVYAMVDFAMAGANLAVAFQAPPRVWALYNSFSAPVVFGGLGLGVYLNFRRVAARRIREAAA